MSRIAFIGVGIMGRPMAGHLQAGGHELFLVRHESALPEELLSGGATECATPAEAASNSDTVILMLPDTPQVEEVLFAAGGVAEGLRQGQMVVDMSSISPIATREFAERIRGLGAEYVDAPVSGGEVGAQSASLTIMVGAAEAAYERVEPLFALMGKNITLVGEVGAGQTCKVANQIVVALNIEAVAEALLFASKAGVDPARVREALLGGFAASRILEVHGERMIERSFDPGFRIRLHQKDLNLALEGARALGLGLPNTASAQELFNTCTANGAGDCDHSALVTALELMANHRVAPARGAGPRK